MRSKRATVLLIATLSVGPPGCSSIQTAPMAAQAVPQANYVAESASTPAQCRALLNRHSGPSLRNLDPRHIQLLNWNIKKGLEHGWESDLHELASDAQLVLIQEAALKPDMLNASRIASFWSFAPGYKSPALQTGVLTISSVEPVTHCNLTAWEPWLGTPKATSITEYGLQNSDQTLVVVNIHALNFTIGVRSYSRQMDEIRESLREHIGPIILSGDFNSWRGAREKRLAQLVSRLGMTALQFDVDQRIQVFGRPIDHIYVRGLKALTSSASAVSSSDHNPMRVRLAMLDH